MQRGNAIYNNLLRLYPRQKRIKFHRKKQRAAGGLDRGGSRKQTEEERPHVLEEGQHVLGKRDQAPRLADVF